MTSPESTASSRAQLARRLIETRTRTLDLVAPIADADLEQQRDRLMSPLAWDLAHIAAYADLWLGRRPGAPAPLRPETFALYDAFEQPRDVRGDLPLLSAPEARAYLRATLDRALEQLEEADLSADADELSADGYLWAALAEHEEQHRETMLQALALAPAGVIEPVRAATPAAPAALPTSTVAVPAGAVAIGAGTPGFAYDNERPPTTVDVAAFRIDRGPVTVGAWRAFMADGGYDRRDLWAADGWRWRIADDVTRPLYWTPDGRVRSFEATEPLRDELPVLHVSWFEADAFARWRSARLPTEAEWEKAATWDPASGAQHGQPWGDDATRPEHATLGGRSFGPAPAGAHPAGASPTGVLGMIGDAWEWTATEFGAYPGFRPFPYREYSEVFFDRGYRVLRGGSWATAPGVARATFRNWDLPQRRQIFAGLRCVEDA